MVLSGKLPSSSRMIYWLCLIGLLVEITRGDEFAIGRSRVCGKNCNQAINNCGNDYLVFYNWPYDGFADFDTLSVDWRDKNVTQVLVNIIGYACNDGKNVQLYEYISDQDFPSTLGCPSPGAKMGEFNLVGCNQGIQYDITSHVKKYISRNQKFQMQLKTSSDTVTIGSSAGGYDFYGLYLRVLYHPITRVNCSPGYVWDGSECLKTTIETRLVCPPKVYAEEDTPVRVLIVWPWVNEPSVIALQNQLNDNTYFLFTAQVMHPDSVTSTVLDQIDVVIFGEDSSWRFRQYYDGSDKQIWVKVRTWLEGGVGRGYLGTGEQTYYLWSDTNFTSFSSTDQSGQSAPCDGSLYEVLDNTHPITLCFDQSGISYGCKAPGYFYGGSPTDDGVMLSTVRGYDPPAQITYRDNWLGHGSRTAWLGPVFMGGPGDSDHWSGMRSGQDDMLLEKTVWWLGGKRYPLHNSTDLTIIESGTYFTGVVTTTGNSDTTADTTPTTTTTTTTVDDVTTSPDITTSPPPPGDTTTPTPTTTTTTTSTSTTIGDNNPTTSPSPTDPTRTLPHTSTPSTTSTSSSSNTHHEPTTTKNHIAEDSSSDITTGASSPRTPVIVGAVVGGLGGLACVSLLVFAVIRKRAIDRQRRHPNDNHHKDQDNESSNQTELKETVSDSNSSQAAMIPSTDKNHYSDNHNNNNNSNVGGNLSSASESEPVLALQVVTHDEVEKPEKSHEDDDDDNNKNDSKKKNKRHSTKQQKKEEEKKDPKHNRTTTTTTTTTPKTPAEEPEKSPAIQNIPRAQTTTTTTTPPVLSPSTPSSPKTPRINSERSPALRLNVIPEEDIVKDQIIGKGNFGEVWKGDWNGTPVAMKKLLDKNQVEEFADELNMLAGINHTKVVRLLGIYTDTQGDQWIITEYMSKGSLLDLLDSEKDSIRLKEMVDIALQICAGMRYLERNGIIHRDLAVRNILVTVEMNKYQVKLSDLGMSRSDGNYYGTAKTKLPIRWSAPEVIKKRKFTCKSDVWAYGVTIWELLEYGSTPYYSLTNQEVVDHVLSHKVLDKPGNCPDRLWDILSTCFAYEPQDRPSFDQLYAKLAEYNKELLEEERYTQQHQLRQQQQQQEGQIDNNLMTSPNSNNTSPSNSNLNSTRTTPTQYVTIDARSDNNNPSPISSMSSTTTPSTSTPTSNTTTIIAATTTLTVKQEEEPPKLAKSLQLSADHTYSITPLNALKDGIVIDDDDDDQNNNRVGIEAKDSERLPSAKNMEDYDDDQAMRSTLPRDIVPKATSGEVF